ncbi:MAG: HlyD family efflux transporter periplasmic adaptor subunit [Bacteroidota bacterium]
MKNKIILFGLLTVSLFSCQQQLEETQAVRKNITETVFATGTLQAEDTYQLMAETEGYLAAVHFEEGDVVSKNKVLVEIENQESRVNLSGNAELYEIAKRNAQRDAPAFQQVQANMAMIRQRLAQDSLQAARYQRLWEQNSIAKVEYETKLLAYQNTQKELAASLENYKKLRQDAEQQVIVAQTNKRLSDLSVRKVQLKAFAAGKVYQKHKEVGDFVRKGEVIATIGHPKNIFARINVDESSIAKVEIGQKVVIQLNTNLSENLDATVREILPTFDAASQSFICELTFNEPLDFKIINTQLQCNIVIGKEKEVLLVPRKYVDFNNQVQVKGEENKRKIETKIVSNEWVQVLAGIEQDDVLVTSVN